MKNWITRWIASALALFVITQLHVGIVLNPKLSPAEKALTLGIVVLVIGFANAFIRPIIMFFAWPINCLTFGLLGFAINVLLFFLAGNMVPGFHIDNPIAALIGSILMGALSGLFNFILKDRGDRDYR